LRGKNLVDTFPRNFPVDGEVVNLLNCYGLATGKLHGVMDFGQIGARGETGLGEGSITPKFVSGWAKVRSISLNTELD